MLLASSIKQYVYASALSIKHNRTLPALSIKHNPQATKVKIKEFTEYKHTCRIEEIVEVVRIEEVVEVVRIEEIVRKMVSSILGVYMLKSDQELRGQNVGTPASKIREYGMYAPAECDRTSSEARELPSMATLP